MPTRGRSAVYMANPNLIYFFLFLFPSFDVACGRASPSPGFSRVFFFPLRCFSQQCFLLAKSFEKRKTRKSGDGRCIVVALQGPLCSVRLLPRHSERKKKANKRVEKIGLPARQISSGRGSQRMNIKTRWRSGSICGLSGANNRRTTARKKGGAPESARCRHAGARQKGHLEQDEYRVRTVFVKEDNINKSKQLKTYREQKKRKLLHAHEGKRQKMNQMQEKEKAKKRENATEFSSGGRAHPTGRLFFSFFFLY